MWLTNGGSSTLVAVLVKTDLGASRSTDMTTFLVEKPAGFGQVKDGLTIPGKIEKMGYKGVDTTELVMEDLGSAPTRSSAASPARASTR